MFAPRLPVYELPRPTSYAAAVQAQTSASLSEAKDDLESGDVDLVVFAPAGLGTGVPLQAFYGRTNPLVRDVALSILRQVVDGLTLRLAGVSSPPVPLRLEAVSAKRIRYYDFLLPGLVGMGALTASVIGMAVTAATFPMMFLSGTFFSTDTLPGWLREVVPYLPLTPLIDAMRKVAVDGLSITETGGELAILAAWVAVLFAVAARTFRFEA